MARLLLEGFDFGDLVNQMDPTVSVDEYSAKMGSDDDIVTLAFTVKGQQASEDVVDWFERGYDWVLDAQVSDGEVSKGKYLVFVEMKRRQSVPEKLIEMIDDLETLTSLKLEDWTITVDETEYSADAAKLKSVMILSPHEYREKEETETSEPSDTVDEMNEMREIAGIPNKNVFKEHDSLLRNFIAKAGL